MVAPLVNASRSIGARRRRRPADVARITRQLTQTRLRTAEIHGLRHQLTAQIAAFADGAAGTAAPDACADSVYRLNFSPDVKVYADRVICDLDVRMVPGFTIAAMPVTWPNGTSAAADASPA